MSVPTHLYILLSVLVLAQIVTSALAAYLWARVSAAPTHKDLTAVREKIDTVRDDVASVRDDIASVRDRVAEVAQSVASQKASSDQTLATVTLIQGYLLERK